MTSIQLTLRALDADARLESRDTLHEVREARVLREIPLQLLPEIGFARIVEARRHHADDRVVGAVQVNDLADDAPIAGRSAIARGDD